MSHRGFDLTGKVALVTGGNSGIGLGMAEALAQAGASVCVWGTNPEKNTAAKARLDKHGGRVLALRCDVADEAAVDAALAAFFTLRAAARHMVERGGGGSLAVTSSLSAIMGAPRSQHYAATKGAVISLMRALAVELARHKIRVNAIVPGWIDTPMTEQALHGEAFSQKVLPRVPLRRWGIGDDFGGIAVYLASDLSAYHTGDTLVIDGGYVLF
jgi:NAD(P)-dependent dehydrogenase (short-subunit alcohol dehydrogenase family)